MASADSDDDDHKSLKEEILTCQLCFEVYKTPKLLSCQHSFCEHCLEQWVETNHGILVCPCCRQHVSLPEGGVKGLPTNRVISHFFDYIDRSKNKAVESKGAPPCETCSSKNADNRCIECSQYLCGRCSTVHSKGKLTRKHRILTIEDFETEKLTNPTIEQPETYCEKHIDAAIELFCQSCEICLCVKCALTEHPNPTHQYVSLDKAAVKPKKDFREFVQKLDQDRKRTADARNAAVHERLQLEKNLKRGMEKIDKHVDKIIQNARDMQKKSQESYRRAFDLKNKVLQSQIQNLERREKSLSNTREFAEMQISYASSAQFLLLKDEMRQQIQNVLTTKVNTDLEENSCLDFEVDASPAVDKFGEVQTSSAVGHMSELDGLNTEILKVGEEHILGIRTKDSLGFNVAAAPYIDAELKLIAVDDVGDVPVLHSKVLPVENSTGNAGLCHVKVKFPTEGTYQLKVSVCGQPLPGTPKLMRVYFAESSTEQIVDENIQLSPGGRPGGVFCGWGRGSSGATGSKTQQEQQEARLTPTNRFQALAFGETQVYDSSRRGSRELGRGCDNKGSRQLSGLRLSSSRESASDGRNREREEAIAINLSYSQALAERGKDTARTQEPQATIEPKNVGNEMSEDAMEKKCKAILEEFMHLRDTREVQTCIAELRSPSMLYIFVRIAVEQSLERNESTRQACGTLMYDLIREGLMEKQQYIKGFAEILEFAEEIAIDIPKFWTYMGEFIAPLVQSGKIPMNILQDISRPLREIRKAGLLTAEVLLVASRIIGEARIAELWHNSGLKWSSLLPAGGDVNEFLERKGLLFTAPNSSRTSSKTATEGMPISKIQGHLEHLLLRERASNDKIFDWIVANVVEDRRKDNDFIRALMTAVCQSAVSGEGSSCRCEINEVKNRAAVLKKYLDNDDKLELQALYALQALNYKLDSPPSLLRIFFDKLYDEDVISEEAFYAWEKSDDPNEKLGKGVALKSVTAFFTWLREADDDSAE
ncbi:eukaryotic translation initiation factor 4 gamma 3-like [Ptychodera flava]|uniref:eukaryotic translation initiation factor 4 gamma 3-like n=1 Tax=Ptychodera flava TaxID=63121 RepID=UPI003969F2F8